MLKSLLTSKSKELINSLKMKHLQHELTVTTTRGVFLQCVSSIWASLTWLKFIIHRLELISTTAPAASKNVAHFKSGQN